ncbi:Auxin-binding protein [Pseudomonas coronafaciens pv. atropurpurea]|nr:Auxin-binding protein [Pseudomonas coronafaciens pv. atropurpurea]
MNERARDLASRLIRNFNEAPLAQEIREPLYESAAARLGTGTAAQKLGASIDVVAPGKRSCPYHFHHAQEEMFVIIEGEGSLRVAGELLPIKTGDIVFIPPGAEYPHQIINTSQAPLKYLSSARGRRRRCVNTRTQASIRRWFQPTEPECSAPTSGPLKTLITGTANPDFNCFKFVSGSSRFFHVRGFIVNSIPSKTLSPLPPIAGFSLSAI